MKSKMCVQAAVNWFPVIDKMVDWKSETNKRMMHVYLIHVKRLRSVWFVGIEFHKRSSIRLS